MPLLKRTRVAQRVQYADFVFNIADTMKNTSGTEVAFSVAAPAFDIIPIPLNSKVVGGAMVVRTVSNESGTATITVGDSLSATRYLSATSIKSAARTALTLTGFVYTAKNALRITLANQNADATAGKVEVSVQFVIEGKGDETISDSQVAL
jgi:hypothetical protein